MNALNDPKTKKAIGVAGGVFAAVSGLRELRKNRGSGTLATVHTALKIVVAVVGIVVALRAAEEIAEDA